MNLFRRLALLSLAFALPAASAAVTLLERDGWKIDLGGFVALDMIRDSTQGVGEIIGNGPVAKPGTYAGSNPRTQFSAKHSRLSIAIVGPEEDGWKNKGYFEGDFLGNSQTAGSTEYSFYSNGTFRMRHAYLSTEKAGWKFLAGQTSLLFGFVPTYLLATVSVVPGPGQIYQRTAQVQGLRSFDLGGDIALDAALAIVRPTQEDSGVPNLDAGMKWQFKKWRARLALMTGELKLEPASLALSGTFRQFKTTDRTTPGRSSRTSATALALSTNLPLLTAESLQAGQSLLFTSSFTSGTGYADVLSGWTGNLAKYPVTGSDSTNLDAGEGAFAGGGGGDFHLIPIQTWNAQLQYHLPATYRTWITGGYARLWSAGVGTLGPVMSGKTLYDGLDFWFLNVAHDFTARIRGALEFSRKNVHYVDGAIAANERVQACFLYRF